MEKEMISINSIVILIPVHDDWESLGILLKNIDICLVNLHAKVTIVVIDDASTVTYISSQFKYDWQSINAIEGEHPSLEIGNNTFNRQERTRTK
jgi:hypothetical protein